MLEEMSTEGGGEDCVFGGARARKAEMRLTP
jgi:hypothetical protein